MTIALISQSSSPGPSVGKTFLQLVVDGKTECGISGSDPVTTIGQAGDLKRLVIWTKDAYTEIQTRCPQWKWMRKSFTLPTAATVDTYAFGACTDTENASPITRFAYFWAHDGYRPMSIYLQSGGVAGQRWLIWIPYDRFKRLYKFGPQQSVTGPPIHCSTDDLKRLVLGPNPDAVYVVTGEYQRSSLILAADGDIPEMPSDYQKLIVYHAMKKYAGYKSAPDVMSRAVSEGNPMMRRLEREQMPEIKLAGALA